MTITSAINLLLEDLDRTAQSVQALRRSVAEYGMFAPVAKRPPATELKRLDHKIPEFLADCCQLKTDAWVRSAHLYSAYRRWCRLRDLRPARPGQFQLRLTAEGLLYSRSRRFRGTQKRTWEGVGLRRRAA